MNKGEIIIYQAPNGETQLDVHLEGETVWLMQEQIAYLFNTKRPAVTKHLGNIFHSGELEENSVCSILEHTAADNKKYRTKFYNLDAILSVGYRINSKNATAFRKWANSVLKDYIIKGYTINEKMQIQQFNDLKQTIKLLSNVIQNKEIALTADEASGLLQVVTDYTYALDTLDKYDYQQTAGNSIRALRKRRRCCSISSRKIIRFQTATNASRHFFSCGFCSKTIFFTVPTALA